MSAFGGKADMTLCGNPLLWSLLGVKRTWVDPLQMFALTQRDIDWAFPAAGLSRYDGLSLSLGGGNETARFHQVGCWFSGGVAARCASTAARDAGGRVPQ